MGYHEVLLRVEELGLDTGWASNGIMFRCPHHDDQTASVHLSEGDNNTGLVYCHAGCRTEDVVQKLGLSMGDLFVEEREVVDHYVYQDEEGKPLYRVLRWEPKGFSIEHWEAE